MKYLLVEPVVEIVKLDQLKEEVLQVLVKAQEKDKLQVEMDHQLQALVKDPDNHKQLAKVLLLVKVQVKDLVKYLKVEPQLQDLVEETPKLIQVKEAVQLLQEKVKELAKQVMAVMVIKLQLEDLEVELHKLKEQDHQLQAKDKEKVQLHQMEDLFQPVVQVAEVPQFQELAQLVDKDPEVEVPQLEEIQVQDLPHHHQVQVPQSLKDVKLDVRSNALLVNVRKLQQ